MAQTVIHRDPDIQGGVPVFDGTRVLLKLAAASYDAFITADQNLQYQQNLSTLPLTIFVLAARSTALADLAPLVPVLLLRLQPIFLS